MQKTGIQGTPWHYEQRTNSCKNGSKYCLYNHNDICGFTLSVHYKNTCVGKGTCEDFESRGNSLLNQKTQKVKSVKKKSSNKNNITTNRNIQKINKSSIITSTNKNNQNKTKEKKEIMVQQVDKKQENFLRLSRERVNKILHQIEVLDNLSNTNSYFYTDEQVDKMFNCIEKALADSKRNFKTKSSNNKFEW